MLLTVFQTQTGWAQNSLSVFAVGGEQKSAKTAASPEISLQEQLAAARERLTRIREELSASDGDSRGGALPAGALADEVDEYRNLHRHLLRLHELQVRALEQLQTMRAAAAEIQREAAEWRGFDVPPPYPLKLGDGLWRDIGGKAQEIRTLHLALTALESELADVTERLKSAVLDLQQSAAQLDAAKPGEDAARLRLRWLLDFKRLKLHAVEAEVAARESERRTITARLAVKEEERAFLVRKLDQADANTHFSQQDLDGLLADLDEEKSVLRKQIEQAEDQSQMLYREHEQAQQQLKQLREQALQKEKTAAPTEGIRSLDRSAALLAARLESASTQRRIMLETSLIIDRIQKLWQQRFTWLHAPGENVDAAFEALRNEQAKFEQLRYTLLSIQAALQRKLTDEGERQKDAGGDAALLKQSLQLGALYRQQADAWLPLQEKLSEYSDLLERTRQEAERRKHSLSFAERWQNLAAKVGETAQQLTNFEIYSVSDTLSINGEEISGTRRVTLGEILLFLFIITAGFWFAARAVRIGRRAATNQFKLRDDSAALIARLAQIVFGVAIVVAALTTMKIPVTVFAFLGGALALAIGFGVQNLLNNFVSGLILLIEQPVKTGDIVDVEGVTGRIIQIGARCCQIRRMDGVEMLVPNSAMIEKTVTNWTLSDRKRRASVTLGIAYGSPVERTRELLEAAVRAHPLVLADPPPQVFFEDFGESALIFTVYYWLDLAHVPDRLAVASDIRIQINRQLTDAGIVIAYPQRDVHFHSARPVEVVIAKTP